jgi:asparagine synthase (glutamine-hydrolysing)
MRTFATAVNYDAEICSLEEKEFRKTENLLGNQNACSNNKNACSSKIFTFSSSKKNNFFSKNNIFVGLQGRIYNSCDLSYSLATTYLSDPQILLETYLKWGEACFENLSGDFAISIWDENKQTLLLARDHFGTIPVYYCQKKSVFFASSTLEQLLPFIDKNLAGINLGFLAEYITDTLNNVDETVYKNIFRLPPASYLKLTKESFQIKKYWDLRPIEITQNKTTFFEQFEELFFNSISKRIKDQSKIGVQLSGGLDSSAIACALSQIKCLSPVSLYSMLFDLPQCDERDYIFSVRDKTKFELKTLPYSIEPDWLQKSKRDGELLYHANCYLGEKMLGFAKNDTCSLLLSGFGGDEILTPRTISIKNLLTEKTFLELSSFLFFKLKDFGTSTLLAKKAKKHLLALFPNLGWKPNWATLALIQDGEIRERLQQKTLLDKNLTKQQCQTYRSIFSPFSIFTKEFEACSSFKIGIDAAFPFLDKNLVEFCFSLPDFYFKGNGHSANTKHILRESLSKILPEKVYKRRDKAEFSFVYAELLSSGFKNTLPNELAGFGVNSLKWVDLNSISNDFATMERLYKAKNSQYISLAYKLWGIYSADSLLRWLKQ